MTRRKISLKVQVLVVALGLVGSLGFYQEVRADITPAFTSVAANGPNFDFTYTMTLGNTQIAQPGIVPGATTNTSVGFSGATNADYVTIYDFRGFTGVHSEPVGWTFQSLLLGSTPSTTIPADDPTIPNLTWYRTGGILAGPLPLGLFVAQSSIGSALTIDNFTSDGTKNAPGDPTNGTAVGTIGTVNVPTAPPSQVPEPASLLLLGSGLAGIGLWGWKRRREV